MDRIQFAAQLISRLPNVNSILDVGCRDCSLQDALPSGLHYRGADLAQNANRTVHYVGDIASISIAEKFDCVAALDILEHVEYPGDLFNKLASLARRYLIVSLPNCYDLKSRLNFSLRGTLGGKYRFGPDVIMDRHRWIISRSEIYDFYAEKATELGFTYRVFDMRYGDPSSKNVASRLRALSRLLLPDDFCTSTVFGEFHKGGQP